MLAKSKSMPCRGGNAMLSLKKPRGINVEVQRGFNVGKGSRCSAGVGSNPRFEADVRCHIMVAFVGDHCRCRACRRPSPLTLNLGGKQSSVFTMLAFSPAHYPASICPNAPSFVGKALWEESSAARQTPTSRMSWVPMAQAPYRQGKERERPAHLVHVP